MIASLPVNSGEQSIQLEFIESTPTPEKIAKEILKDQSEKQQPVVDEIEKSTAIEKREIVEPIDTVVKDESKIIEENAPTPIEEKLPKKEKPLTEEITPQMTVAENSKVKITTQDQQASSQLNAGVDDSLLKAELFSQEFNLPTQTYDTSPEAIELLADAPASKVKKQPATLPRKTVSSTNSNTEPKIKTVLKSPTPTPIRKAKAVEPAKTANKAVVKKQLSKNKPEGVLQEAIVVSGKIPAYPKTAILRGQQGRVVVKLTITMQGKAKDPQIITSSGHSTLDNAVLDFVKRELFMPAHKGVEKITSEQIFAFRFEIK